MQINSSTTGYIAAGVMLLILLFTMRRKGQKSTKAQINPFDRLVYFMQSKASKVVVVSLVLNTMIAQLLYNSAGQLVIGNGFLLGYLIASAASSTLAFALFEVSVIFQLHDLMALDESIKTEIKAEKLIHRGFFVLGVSSFINFLSVFYFLALAWHTVGHHAEAFPLDNLPAPWNYVYDGFHAAAYTVILFLAGIFGERPKSSKEIVLATQRSLEQQSMEAWQMQQEANIAQMRKSGRSLSPVAAALGSPETATRVALLDVAMQGNISAMDAANAHIATGTAESSILSKLASLAGMAPTQTEPTVIEEATPEDEEVAEEETEKKTGILSFRRHKSRS
jgi:hypothetical protein